MISLKRPGFIVPAIVLAVSVSISFLVPAAMPLAGAANGTGIADNGGIAVSPAPPVETTVDRKGDESVPETPGWGKNREELFYRLTFLGVTAGYARFTIMGRTIVDGRPAWHLHVRGWTSQFLSVFYPVNNIMDYYLDVKTLAPIKIAVTKNEKNKFTDEVITYDQDKGLITYWDKSLKKIEKKVEVVPNVHDPVTAVYYFRAKDAGVPDRSRNVYAGRKLWQISSTNGGTETVPDETGQPVETTVIRPVIRRDGKLESKGDIKLWLTNDARRVPVKIYASIKIGTLVGKLIPPQEGG